MIGARVKILMFMTTKEHFIKNTINRHAKINADVFSKYKRRSWDHKGLHLKVQSKGMSSYWVHQSSYKMYVSFHVVVISRLTCFCRMCTHIWYVKITKRANMTKMTSNLYCYLHCPMKNRHFWNKCNIVEETNSSSKPGDGRLMVNGD